jgi:hypothetical protein
MAKSDQPGRKPTHTVSHVKDNGKDGYWTKIGAGWIHEDGEGLNINLDYLPVNGGRLVIRANKADAQSQGEAAR